MSNVLLSSSIVEMTSDRFEGWLPRLSPNIKMLNLANNSFFGPISPFLCQEMNGESLLEVLDLSNNILSGELSHCSMQWQYLANINLGRNNLSGKVPNLMGSLRMLKSLQLHNNKFIGEIPLSLRNCTSLSFIDLGGNELTGLIPSWIGDMLHMEILSLRSNKFIGNIPTQKCQLSDLIILDLRNNNLSGPIPKCWKNISAMITTNQQLFGNFVQLNNNFVESYINILSLVTKGRESEYKNILGLVRTTLEILNFVEPLSTTIAQEKKDLKVEM
ncbi:receptor-like protein EIX2 [Cornus florida]|uniref:receptor-like protein EIX2 n=1 Tax=Cornus florida TaxID=4283 RepID=UPI00289A57C7|nr:receptor-like protein EIX2 [Cornus florida]